MGLTKSAEGVGDVFEQIEHRDRGEGVVGKRARLNGAVVYALRSKLSDGYLRSVVGEFDAVRIEPETPRGVEEKAGRGPHIQDRPWRNKLCEVLEVPGERVLFHRGNLRTIPGIHSPRIEISSGIHLAECRPVRLWDQELETAAGAAPD